MRGAVRRLALCCERGFLLRRVAAKTTQHAAGRCVAPRDAGSDVSTAFLRQIYASGTWCRPMSADENVARSKRVSRNCAS